MTAGATTKESPVLPAAPGACPVCRAALPQAVLSVEGRDYWRCAICEARFLDPCQRLAREEYAHCPCHENDPGDLGHRRFLSKLAGPLLARLSSKSHGLDYDCGQGPALAADGHDVVHRDIGGLHSAVGGESQMAIFELAAGAGDRLAA